MIFSLFSYFPFIQSHKLKLPQGTKKQVSLMCSEANPLMDAYFKCADGPEDIGIALAGTISIKD